MKKLFSNLWKWLARITSRTSRVVEVTAPKTDISPASPSSYRCGCRDCNPTESDLLEMDRELGRDWSHYFDEDPADSQYHDELEPQETFNEVDDVDLDSWYDSDGVGDWDRYADGRC